MTADPRHMYWDTCVFVAYLNDERLAYGSDVDDIGHYLEEASAGKRVIYTSTLTIAEIPRSRLKSSCRFATFREFLDDFMGAVVQIVPDPNIMELAGDLHGMRYIKSDGKRRLETPDAIHLASALALQQVYGVPLDVFHTFDNGSHRGIGGRAVPLLTYETWCEQCANETVVQDVIRLRRVRPKHPAPKLLP